MRFYAICFCIMTAALLLFPLMSLQPVQEESKGTDGDFIAVVEPLPMEIREDKLTNDLPKLLSEPVTTLKIKSISTDVIDTIPLEEYVLGAVCSEMPASFHLEALKAQAVSARTWAVYQQQWQQLHPDAALDGADFQADPENWKGYVTIEQAQDRFGSYFEEYWALLSQAVEETQGQIICYEGEPIAAAYHAISAGKTEAAEYVWGFPLNYLQAVESVGDELSPGYEASCSFSKKELAQRLSVKEAELWLEIMERSPSAYVTKIQTGAGEISGSQFRTALGLRSSCFTIAYEEDSVTITTKGYGHGAGLSQYGADYMARQGSDYREILAHYYPHTVLFCW